MDNGFAADLAKVLGVDDSIVLILVLVDNGFAVVELTITGIIPLKVLILVLVDNGFAVEIRDGTEEEYPFAS